MVESKYNYYITDDDDKCVICLNGISRKIFSVEIKTFTFLKQLFTDEELQKEEPEIVKWLVNMCFLVNDNKSETDYLLKLNRENATSGLYHLVINPTQDCIFRCWYCYETHLQSRMDGNVIENIKKLIVKTLDREDISQFMLGWFGGEPLMYFDEIVYPLSRFAKHEAESRGKKFFCTMTTNGFLLSENLIKQCKEFDLNSLQITLDGDEKNHNKTRNRNGEPSFQKILDNCINYCSYSVDNRLVLRINYTDRIIKTDFSEVLENIPADLRPQIEVQFKRVWQTYDIKKEKTPEGLLQNMEKLRNKNFKLAYHLDMNFVRGCLCYADRKNYANINFDGKVYRCTAMDYNAANSLGYLDNEGNIIWNDGKIRGMEDKAYFEDTKCMDCNLLPVCGGPCFMRKYQSITQNKDFCVKDKLDSDISVFVKQYYRTVQKNKNII